MPSRTPRLDDQLCFSLYAASHAFNRFYRPLLEPHGLTYPQYLVLLALWDADSQSITSIGERLFLDSGTLTPLVRRMEQAGYVTRSRDTADERRVVVALTQRGAGFRAIAAAFPQALGEASGCSAAEIAALRGALFGLRATLDRSAA